MLNFESEEIKRTENNPGGKGELFAARLSRNNAFRASPLLHRQRNGACVNQRARSYGHSDG
jgi:hypothetical protein